MTLRVSGATGRRVLAQLRGDPRTVVLLLGSPLLLITLLRYVFDDRPEVFDRVGGPVLALFPFVTMFLVTSVAVLRERSSGTLERLLTTPMAKGDLLLGYALAFGAVAVLQSALAVTVAVGLLGLDLAAGVGLVVLVAVLDALLGTALGLFLSAFARTEFQAVQFLPATAFPQLLVCGLFGARAHMAPVLRWASAVFPLTYAVDAMQQLTVSARASGALLRDIAVVVAASALALALGAVTLRRQTP